MSNMHACTVAAAVMSVMLSGLKTQTPVPCPAVKKILGCSTSSPQWHRAAGIDLPSVQQWCIKWSICSAICRRWNSQKLSCLRWNKPQETRITKCSPDSHFLCFLLNCFLITAAEMSMPDAPRCWQDIPRFWRTGMFYPFPITHVDSLILNWKYTLKSRDTHRLQKMSKHQQMEKTFHSTNLCIQKLSPLGGLCSGGGPPWHVMSVDCVQCEYQL